MKLRSSDNHYTTGPQRPVYTASELEDFMEAFDDGVNFLQPKLSLKLKKQFQLMSISTWPQTDHSSSFQT